MTDVPEIDLSDPAVVRDPFAAYAPGARAAPVARLVTPGFGADVGGDPARRTPARC